MTKLSVADSITIIEPSKPELESAQEMLKTYLMKANAEARAKQAELDALSDRVTAP
jgi:prefoldin subunit 5